MKSLKFTLCVILATATLTLHSSEISLNDLMDFAKRVETSVIKEKGKFLDKALDKEFFGAKCTRGNGKRKLKDLFLKGFFSTFKYGAAISQATIKGHYKMVRCYKDRAKSHIIFRMLANNGALNYHDFWVVKNKKGEIKIVDCYVYSTGENLSDTINRMFIRWNASMDPSFLDKLLKKDKHFNANMEIFSKMTKATNAGKPKEAITFYKKLSPKFQKMKMSMLIACKNYASFDNKAYVAKLKEYKGLFPGDPSLSLMLIDFYFLKKDYKKTLKTIDELDESLGGDPYLNLHRAYVHQQLKQFKKTQHYAKEAMLAIPSLADAYATFISASLETKDFASVTEGLNLLGKNGFEITRKDILEDPDYKEYVKSKEFKKWKGSRTKSLQ